MNEFEQKYKNLIYFRQHIAVLQKTKHLTETHHIKMSSLWPKLVDDPNNIVELTTYEHILAHKYLKDWYLTKYGYHDNRYKAACKALWFMMISREGNEMSIVESAKFRQEYKKMISESRKNKPLSKKNRESITKTWQTSEMRDQQSKRIKQIYSSNPQIKQKLSDKGKQFMKDNPWMKEHLSKAAKLYSKQHPEKAIKHSQDIKDRESIYDGHNKVFRKIKKHDIRQYLDNGWALGTPIFRLIHRGKNKGQLQILFMCPWTVDTCSYLKPTFRGFPSGWSKQCPKLIVSELKDISVLPWIKEQFMDIVYKSIDDHMKKE